MNIDILSNRPMPEGKLGVFTPKQFSSYELTLRASQARELLDRDDATQVFLDTLDPDLRDGGLSIHVPNKNTVGQIKFSGATLTLSLGGDLRDLSKQERMDLMQQVAQLLANRYEFTKVNFRNPMNERQLISIEAENQSQ